MVPPSVSEVSSSLVSMLCDSWAIDCQLFAEFMEQEMSLNPHFIAIANFPDNQLTKRRGLFWLTVLEFPIHDWQGSISQPECVVEQGHSPHHEPGNRERDQSLTVRLGAHPSNPKTPEAPLRSFSTSQ